MIHRRAWLLTLFLLVPAGEAGAQEGVCTFRGAPDALAERPSPLDSIEVRLGDAAARLCYGRPSTRGRTIVGGLEPWGTPWRMGANEPTTIHLPFPAAIGSVEVAPGAYTLYAIPEPESWTIVVNANTSRWGIPINPEVRRSDVGSFAVTPDRLSSPVETLTLSFEGSGNVGSIVYAWEETTFRIPIERR